MGVLNPLAAFDTNQSAQNKINTSRSIRELGNIAGQFKNSGLDTNLYNQFQARIPGQTVTALNMARQGVDQQARAGGLASGTAARMKTKLTNEQLAKMEMSRLRGFRIFQEQDRLMRTANKGQFAAMKKGQADMNLRQQLADMQMLTQLTGQKVSSDTALTQAQMAADAQAKAAKMGMIGSLAGGVTSGLFNLGASSMG